MIERDQALEKLKISPYDSEVISKHEAYVAKKFGLEVSELKKLLEIPAKSYYDFPNQKKLIDLMYNFYNKWLNKSRL